MPPGLTNVPQMKYVLLEGLVITRVMFKCVSMKHGDMCVITVGTVTMLKLFVGNLVSPRLVSEGIVNCYALEVCCSYHDFRCNQQI